MAKNQQTLSKAAFKTTFPAAYNIMSSDGWNVKELGEFLEQPHVVALGASIAPAAMRPHFKALMKHRSSTALRRLLFALAKEDDTGILRNGDLCNEGFDIEDTGDDFIERSFRMLEALFMTVLCEAKFPDDCNKKSAMKEHLPMIYELLMATKMKQHTPAFYAQALIFSAGYDLPQKRKACHYVRLCRSNWTITSS
jgi:hypothetical protein